MKGEDTTFVEEVTNPTPPPLEPPELTTDIPTWLQQPLTIFDTAKEIVYGDREQTYGHPAKNLEAIAILWTAHIHAKYGINLQLNSEDVAWMMVQLKSARAMNTYTRDNQVDAIGYIGLVERIQETKIRAGE